MHKKKPVVLVVGASGGLGNFTAMYLAKRGYRVYGTARNPSSILKRADEFFEYVEMDVLDSESISTAVNAILELEGRIDILVYSATIWQTGALEDTSIAEMSAMFETNFFGLMRVLTTTLKPMRESGGGRIVVTSSVAGIYPFPFQSAYCATKAAAESALRSLRMELREQGIFVTMVRAGDFISMSPAGRKMVGGAVSQDSIYREQFDRTVGVFAHDTLRGQMPIEFAKTVLKAIEAKLPKRVYRSGAGFVFDLAPLLDFLPGRLSDFIIRKYYGIP